MHNVLTDIHVEGDISFSGNLIGNLPGTSISTEPCNSITNNNGLYSAFGFEDFKAEDVIDHGSLTISEAISTSNTIISSAKPSRITSHKWYTILVNTDQILSSILVIPTLEGKYLLLSNYPGDGNGGVFVTQGIYLKDDSSTTASLFTVTSPNDNISSWITADHTKTNYNSLIHTGRHLVQGVNDSELSTYNAPFASIDPVVVYVQSDVSVSTAPQYVSQFVISHDGLFYRSGSINNLPVTWTNLLSNSSTPVNISALPDNIVENKSDGLYVSGKSPIIPKYTSTGLWMPITSPSKIFPNANRYTTTVGLTNPTGVRNYNNVSLYKLFKLELQHYLLDASGNLLQTNLEYLTTTTTADTITIKVILTVFGTPSKCYSLNDDSIWPSDGTLSNLQVSITSLVGTTATQLGYN